MSKVNNNGTTKQQRFNLRVPHHPKINITNGMIEYKQLNIHNAVKNIPNIKYKRIQYAKSNTADIRSSLNVSSSNAS
jgi:hypothetical protein